MAVERALTQPKVKKAPKDAFCYICLEGEDGGKLMRGCACRGTSAGFVHVECLAELAMSKDESGDFDTIFDGWNQCGNCKQSFQGVLEVEMQRRFWRYHRSGQDRALRFASLRCLANCLGNHGEVDATNQLLAEANACAGNREGLRPDVTVQRIEMLKRNGQMLEALGLLQAMVPEAKVSTGNPALYGYVMLQIADVFLNLDRYQEAHEAAAELVAYNKARYGFEDTRTLSAMSVYARACGKLGRIEEAKANFEDVLTTQTRLLGREHPHTKYTIQVMRTYGVTEPSG